MHESAVFFDKCRFVLSVQYTAISQRQRSENYILLPIHSFISKLLIYYTVNNLIIFVHSGGSAVILHLLGAFPRATSARHLREKFGSSLRHLLPGKLIFIITKLHLDQICEEKYKRIFNSTGYVKIILKYSPKFVIHAS